MTTRQVGRELRQIQKYHEYSEGMDAAIDVFDAMEEVGMDWKAFVDETRRFIKSFPGPGLYRAVELEAREERMAERT